MVVFIGQYSKPDARFDCISLGYSLCVHYFHNGFVFHLWIKCRRWPTTDGGVMEKLITMGLDSKSFQDLVMVCSYVENSLCPQTSAQLLLLSHSPCLSNVTKMKSSFFNLLWADVNPCKKKSLCIVHSVQVPHQVRFVCLGQRGTICQIQWGEHHFILASVLSLASSLHNPVGMQNQHSFASHPSAIFDNH